MRSGVRTIIRRRRASGAVAYSGPGDVVASAYAWYGLRAYSSAARGTNAIRIRRASDSAETDIVTLTDGSLDVATASAFIGGSTAIVITFYDQTGNGRTMLESGLNAGGAITLSGVASKPQIHSDGASNSYVVNVQTISQPYTITTVARRTASFTSFQGVVSLAGIYGLIFSNSADKMGMYAGTATGEVAFTDSTFHAMVGVFNGASSEANVDGANLTPSPQNVGTNGVAAGSLGLLNMGGTTLTGDFREAGYWASGFDATQRIDMGNNQKAFWGL